MICYRKRLRDRDEIEEYLLDTENETIFTREEIANYLDVCLSTLNSYIKSGRIRTKYINGRQKITSQTLRNYLKDNGYTLGNGTFL